MVRLVVTAVPWSARMASGAKPATLLTTMALGILPGAQQAIVPGHLRGMTAALGVLTVNFRRLGIGADGRGPDYRFWLP